MKKPIFSTVFLLVSALTLTGCYSMHQSSGAFQGQNDNVYANNQQSSHSQKESTGELFASMQQQQVHTMSQVSGLNERVRRVERAMIRLDRRMQILERNELARITAMRSNASQQGFQSASFTNNQPDYGTLTSPFARGAATMTRGMMMQASVPAPKRHETTIRPVSQGAVSGVTASLQPKGGFLPSLADEAEEEKFSANADVAIWTVQYERSKIWPDRDQLSGANDVVEALQADKPIALFARGANPGSREFRERVRAISRYLGRAARLDSVPIASLPAKHLGSDTIEVMVAQ